MSQIIEKTTSIISSHTGRDKVCRALYYAMMFLIPKLKNVKDKETMLQTCEIIRN